MNDAIIKKDDMVLVSRRRWLELSILATVIPAAFAQQLVGDTTGNVNRLGALWLAITTGQNYSNDTFGWDSGFVTTIPKDNNPAVPNVFAQVKSIVEGRHADFASVATAWNNLASQLNYSHPDMQPGILALANTAPSH